MKEWPVVTIDLAREALELEALLPRQFNDIKDSFQ
jgi:hypothetical protein